MSYPASLLVSALLAYIIGASPFGYLAGRMKGIDIREHGSGNIGATNVLRTLGKPAGITVFVMDILKGAIPVLLARWLCGSAIEAGAENRDALLSAASALAGLAAIVGHNFTFWLGFRGGKGVATSAGALVAIMPVPVLVGVVVWLALYYGTGYVAVASMGSGLSLPFSVLGKGLWGGEINWIYFVLGLLVASMAIVRHRSNIQRLREGTEHCFRRGKKEEPEKT